MKSGAIGSSIALRSVLNRERLRLKLGGLFSTPAFRLLLPGFTIFWHLIIGSWTNLARYLFFFCLWTLQLTLILQNPTVKMAAVDMSLVARSEYAVHQLMKRKNWAQREPGVIVVFVIVFLVAILVLAMFINKKVSARKRAPAA